MGAGGDLDVKPLLQRLQPAQRHAEAGVALSGRDRLEQLVGRAGIVDELDVEIVLLEEAVLDGDRHGREADGAGIPRQFQLARSASKRRCIRCCLAQWKFREVDGARTRAAQRRVPHQERRTAQQRLPQAPPGADGAGRDSIHRACRHCSSVPLLRWHGSATCATARVAHVPCGAAFERKSFRRRFTRRVDAMRKSCGAVAASSMKWNFECSTKRSHSLHRHPRER